MRAQTTDIETGDCSPKSAFFTIDLAAVTLNIAKGKNIRTQVRTQGGGLSPAPLGAMEGEVVMTRSAKSNEPAHCFGAENGC